MASILFKFKWLVWALGAMTHVNMGTDLETYTKNPSDTHPFYVSVTEIEHNSKDKTLEISCKIFSDDFEKTLRKNCNCKVDLLHPADKAAMDQLVSDYVKKHLSLKINNKNVVINYLGYESIDESVYSYWQVDGVQKISQIEVKNNLLYDYNQQQVNVVHVTVMGKRKSSRLNYPNTKVGFKFRV